MNKCPCESWLPGPEHGGEISARDSDRILVAIELSDGDTEVHCVCVNYDEGTPMLLIDGNGDALRWEPDAVALWMYVRPLPERSAK